ncbi:MAG: FAD-binding protein, partial [Spirochaetia bacterium]
DLVARSIYQEMEVTGSGYVLLDAMELKTDPAKRFPGIYEKCKEIGLDLGKEPIPVVPAAHYFCGGIKTDLHGKTSIKNLYAIGESACTGVHGSNRLASVSLLEGLFFSGEAAKKIQEKHKQVADGLLASIPEWKFPKQEEDFDTVLIHHDMLNIQMTMWDYVGILRTRKRLFRALSDLNYLNHRIERFYKEAKLTKEIVNLRNAVVTATLITKAALSNPNSRGCHYVVSS